MAKRSYLTNDGFNAVHGAAPEELAPIEKFAQEAELRFIDASIPKRRVRVEGAIANFGKAFAVSNSACVASCWPISNHRIYPFTPTDFVILRLIAIAVSANMRGVDH